MVKHFSHHMILSQSPRMYTGFAIKAVLHVTVLRKPQVLTIHFRDPHKSEEAVVCIVIFISSILGISRAASKSTKLRKFEIYYSQIFQFSL